MKFARPNERASRPELSDSRMIRLKGAEKPRRKRGADGSFDREEAQDRVGLPIDNR
ncbi:MAG: hypothetical protein OEZ32_13000 [Nitrospinota bacterium]|nr:hypothetical protein [Nitrospinota bacterium]